MVLKAKKTIAMDTNEHRIHGALGVVHIVVGEFRRAGVQQFAVAAQAVVGAGAQDHQGRGGANEEGVDIHGEGLGEALLRRMRDVGGRRDDGARALAGLVGEDAALDAHGDGGADDAAADGVDAEGVRDDGREHRGDVLDMEADDHQRHQDVAEGHERRDDGGHPRDALDAAEDDEAQDDREGDAGGEGRDRESVLDGRRDAVGLDRRQEEAAGEDGDGRERDAEPFLAQPVLDEAEGTAPVAGVVRELVDLRQGGLHEGRRCAEEGDDPHPEHRAGAAEGDGRRHAHDVAGAHASGQGDAERLERRDALRALLLGEEGLEHQLEPADLHEPRPEREIQPGGDQQHDQPGIPDDIIDLGDNLF